MVTLPHTSLYLPKDFRKVYNKFVKMTKGKTGKTIRDLIRAYVQSQVIFMADKVKGDRHGD